MTNSTALSARTVRRALGLRYHEQGLADPRVAEHASQHFRQQAFPRLQIVGSAFLGDSNELGLDQDTHADLVGSTPDRISYIFL